MITLIVPEFGEYGVFTKTGKGWAGPLGMDQIVDFSQCLEVIAERDKRIAELEGQLEECNQVRFHYFQGR